MQCIKSKSNLLNVCANTCRINHFFATVSVGLIVANVYANPKISDQGPITNSAGKVPCKIEYQKPTNKNLAAHSASQINKRLTSTTNGELKPAPVYAVVLFDKVQRQPSLITNSRRLYGYCIQLGLATNSDEWPATTLYLYNKSSGSTLPSKVFNIGALVGQGEKRVYSTDQPFCVQTPDGTNFPTFTVTAEKNWASAKKQCDIVLENLQIPDLKDLSNTSNAASTQKK